MIAIDFLEQEKMTKAKISGVSWEYDQKADLAATKLRQEAYRPVYQLIAPHIQSILIAAAFEARKNAALVGGSSHSTSTSSNYDGQSKNVRLVVLVFYGRREMFQITHIYLEMNLRANGGIVDEVRLVPNTNNTDDVVVVQSSVSISPLLSSQQHMRSSQPHVMTRSGHRTEKPMDVAHSECAAVAITRPVALELSFDRSPVLCNSSSHMMIWQSTAAAPTMPSR